VTKTDTPWSLTATRGESIYIRVDTYYRGTPYTNKLGGWLWYANSVTDSTGVRIASTVSEPGSVWFLMDSTNSLGLSTNPASYFAQIILTNATVLAEWSRGTFTNRNGGGITGTGTAPTATTFNVGAYSYVGVFPASVIPAVSGSDTNAVTNYGARVNGQYIYNGAEILITAAVGAVSWPAVTDKPTIWPGTATDDVARAAIIVETNRAQVAEALLVPKADTNGAEWGSHADLYPRSNPSNWITAAQVPAESDPVFATNGAPRSWVAGFSNAPATYNATEATLNVTFPDGTVGQMFQELWSIVKNTAGVSLTNGVCVRSESASGALSGVHLASATDSWDQVLGVIGLSTYTAPVAPNGDCKITTFGNVNELDTTAFIEGSNLWLSATPGQLTMSMPTNPAHHRILIGRCLRSHANEGRISVAVRAVPNPADIGAVATSDTNGWTVTTHSGLLISGVGGATINGELITNGAAFTIAGGGGSGGGLSNIVVAGVAGTLSGSGSNVLASVSLASLAGAGVATNGQPVTLAQLPAAVLTNSAEFATAAQGTKADTALQPADTNGWVVSSHSAFLTAETDPIWGAVSNTVRAGAAAGATALQPTGSGSGLTGITAAQVGAVPTNRTLTINGQVGSMDSNLTFTVAGGGGSGGGLSNIVVAGVAGTLSGSGSNVVASVSLDDLAGAGVLTNGQHNVTLGTNVTLAGGIILTNGGLRQSAVGIAFSDTATDNMGLESATYPVSGQTESAWIGFSALYQSPGSYNSAQGYFALRQSTGSYNSAIGSSALRESPGSYNNAIGFTALRESPGSYNNAIGCFAGYRSGGSSNTWIGFESGKSASTTYYTNTIAIGAGAVPLGNNSTVIGNALTTNALIYGLTAAQVGAVSTNDQRYLAALTSGVFSVGTSVSNLNGTLYIPTNLLQGATGPQGPAGTNGADGASGITNAIVSRIVTYDTTNPVIVLAEGTNAWYWTPPTNVPLSCTFSGPGAGWAGSGMLRLIRDGNSTTWPTNVAWIVNGTRTTNAPTLDKRNAIVVDYFDGMWGLGLLTTNATVVP
jgi:hypothetical protein